MHSSYIDTNYPHWAARRDDAMKQTNHDRLCKSARDGAITDQSSGFSRGTPRLELKIATAMLIVVITMLLIGSTAVATGWVG